jgi:hypothetical protein
MLASSRRNRRRGIILVLILAMLGLMAVIGFTFATFSGQARISARNFAQSVIQPQRDELMDYALAQLISDTTDIRSAIRGHSLVRDMYGNDAITNGYLTQRPDGAYMAPHNDPFFYVTAVSTVPLPAPPTQYELTTNIPLNDQAFYGYNFLRWTIRLSYVGAITGTGVVNQSFEILVDNTTGVLANGTATQFRAFRVNINPTDQTPALQSSVVSTTGTSTYNTQLPGQYLVAASAGAALGTAQIILDGRWLRAFNGPGMTSNAVHGNFRYNGLIPNSVGMDEDYDAADLENWFLAMQSADGSVIIPSFHRPAAIRYDPNGTAGTAINDWTTPTTSGAPAPTWQDSASRILRPRQTDGHDPTTFPDLVPGSNGKITYDVDNDGDGLTDSVWVDLGYPAQRNGQGQLYKPLFSFMVIGLNGRIPLNTAGNLAGGHFGNPATHAAHLGNSPSELDPTYGLQNAFVFANDAVGAFLPQPYLGPYTAANTQVDNVGTDVRLTQIRNLLAGTRPQANPAQPDLTGQINGDNNFVLWNNNATTPIPYFMPNGIADQLPTSTDVDGYGAVPPNAVLRLTTPVPGRWGESQQIPGYPTIPSPTPPPPFLNLVTNTYNNHVRAGYSLDTGDIVNGTARDAADDNLNSFDPYPPTGTIANPRGEVGDNDFLDAAGAYLLPVERWRRFVTPADINGTGKIVQYDGVNSRPGPDLGADQWGRVEFSSYFRPPGLPGEVPPTPPAGVPLTTPVTFTQWTGGLQYPNWLVSNVPTPAVVPPPPWTWTTSLYNNNNPLHGFEAQRFPNLNYTAGAFNAQRAGGVPVDLNKLPGNANLPGMLPTYDAQTNGRVQSDGLNEADEMNLYHNNALLDSPYGFGDLEWLYRQQDIDGASLTSRLAQLAPISFSNLVDGQRRRRLYALDSWELNNYAWTNDNPGNVFPNNSTFSFNLTPPPFPQDASFVQLGANLNGNNPPYAAPTIVHRDKKINLNYPLPVSNDPDEAVRNKWITDTYNTLKKILPPKAVDSAEELAQLSQFVINIVDFRDPDATMTHWVNPDVYLRRAPAATGPSPFLVLLANYNAATDVPVNQYGMEYNPIAINEVMAYSFATGLGAPAPAQSNRFFIELVNTLTSPELGTTTIPGLGNGPANASVLDLAGFQSNPNPPLGPPLASPWAGGCWDLLFANDDAQSRLDPVLGQLQQGGTYYSLIPFTQASFTGATTDPVIYPLPQTPPNIATGYPQPTTAAAQPVGLGNLFVGLQPTPTTPAWTYNPQAPSYNTLSPGYFLTIGNTFTPGTETTPYTPALTLNTAWDPMNNAAPATAVPPGVMPNNAVGNPVLTYPTNKLPVPAMNSGMGTFYWVYLRRPANPFAPVSATNPMLVVDAMRFPYIEGNLQAGPPVKQASYFYSYQRLQPYRGGHAVAMPGVPTAIDPRYGYSEQIAALPPLVPDAGAGNQSEYNGNPAAGPAAQYYYHSLGLPNDNTVTLITPTPAAPPYYTFNEPWDYFPFNDRDFTSVAELLMVPGCPPGLFTKQFAEFAPSSSNLTTFLGNVKPLGLPFTATALPVAGASASPTFNPTPPTYPFLPHSFPYLVDKFFYSGANPATAPANPVFGDGSGDGWFKMFEFFEVPSLANGAIGPVAQGVNFDWMRQDTKPGLINLNLIIDEEVFFSVFGQQDAAFNQQFLNFNQLPVTPFTGASIFSSPATFNSAAATATTLPAVAGTSPVPMVVTATTANGSPAAAYPMNNVGVVAPDRLSPNPTPPPPFLLGSRMKAAFAQFLSVRHGGSGYVFGYGSGLPGQNTTVLTGNPNAAATPAAAMLAPIPADRPFHSLSYPDIDYTIMRPAALPPSTVTDPVANTPAVTWPPNYNTAGNNYRSDPGIRNTSVYQGFLTALSATPAGSTPQSTPAVAGPGTTPFLLPPAIPPRRLFQPPDINAASNASDTGDPYLDNLVPVTATAATGALPPFGATPIYNGVNLVWPAVPFPPPAGYPTPYLGANSKVVGVGPPPVYTAPYDTKQHPYFRTEMLQKAINLTTVRTHQYAVWITIGFFEVARQGDVGMINSPAPWLAFDILGPELGATSGRTTRYRGFFVVDRLQLFKFDPNTPDSFRPAVVYRQTIE